MCQKLKPTIWLNRTPKSKIAGLTHRLCHERYNTLRITSFMVCCLALAGHLSFKHTNPYISQVQRINYMSRSRFDHTIRSRMRVTKIGHSRFFIICKSYPIWFNLISDFLCPSFLSNHWSVESLESALNGSWTARRVIQKKINVKRK